MKDIKHIRRDFHLVAWVMPQGWDFGVPWWVGGSKNVFPKFNQIWCGSYLHECHMQRHHFWVPAPWGLGEGPKGQLLLNLNYKVNFKDFKPNFVYLLTNERYIAYQTRFHSAAWVVPRGWALGTVGVTFFSGIQPDLV